MPIYEYECLDCGARFEALLFGSEKAVCPECSSSRLEKMTSSFAVGSSPSTPRGCDVSTGGG